MLSTDRTSMAGYPINPSRPAGPQEQEPTPEPDPAEPEED